MFEHTLMPTRMRGRFSAEELADFELAEPFAFTKGVRTIRVAGRTFFNPYRSGTLLYDLRADPEQRAPIVDDTVELRMASLLVELLRANDAPVSAALSGDMFPTKTLRVLAEELSALRGGSATISLNQSID
ncbi:hypothetical protein [Streptomyces sp. NPDC056987]|uniref:hypothetical protein n=1 Tax=Streptomyces sp. NPDC056987 TaxID=3345988 RepID=UPI0036297BF1